MNISTWYAGFRSKSELRSAWNTVAEINKLADWAANLSTDALRDEFQSLKSVSADKRIVKGFACVREMSSRVLGLRQFDVQLIGGLVLLSGKLAEMRTGEGKTLTIAAPAALLALDGKGTHVVTANSYLAKRDADLMAPLYEALGLTVSFVDDDQSVEEKQAAYAADITYGVGHEFGFDYLKDNMVRDASRKVQRPLHCAIVDEIDSILIDEARVPLIISTSAADISHMILAIDQAIKRLESGKHFVVNQKERQVTLTESGYSSIEKSLVESGLIGAPQELYDVQHLALVRHVHASAQAYGLFRKDKDYVIENNELVLVDQGTGRKMPGRRFEDGLHEALEAREGLEIQRGSATRATITYQNFFGQYNLLAGLSGTALTDADEFAEIYGLETVAVPTNRPIIRKENDDVVFLTKHEKFTAACDEIIRRQSKGQPTLVGCATIRDAEVISRMLESKNVRHEVLSAKHLEREALIIAQAGRPGAVTVATNMAGRGTDIILGGEKPSLEDFENEDAFAKAEQEWAVARDLVRAAGGLFVLGTERNGLRRVDNQLAGRSGRQGDPGEVQFYLSLEDELLRVFSTSGRLGAVQKLVEMSGSALSGKHVSKLVTTAQQKFEGQGFEARKTLMKFDSVLADQRNAVYSLRNSLLEEGLQAHCEGLISDAMTQWLDIWLPEAEMPEQWDLGAAKKNLESRFGFSVPLVGMVHKDEMSRAGILDKLLAAALEHWQALALPDSTCANLVFGVLDEMWTEHLTALAELRKAADLKGTTGLNPVYQYHKDAFELFKHFEAAISMESAVQLLNVHEQTETREKEAALNTKIQGDNRVALEAERRWIRRNEPCPCGSGARYKDCHGKL